MNFSYRVCEGLARQSEQTMGCMEWVDRAVNPSGCLAARLWKPFQSVVYNPVYSLVVLLIVYLVFVILLPFWMASWIVGSWEAWSAFCIC